MSYTIEYSRKVFVQKPGSLSEPDYYVFRQYGDNNVQPRPRTWHLTCSGWNYSIVAKICEAAGWTEGGGLKLSNGDTTPERYLAMYRKLIEKAIPLTVESLREHIGIRTLRIDWWNVTDIQKHGKRAIEREHGYRVKELIDLLKDHSWQRRHYASWYTSNGDSGLELWRPLSTLDDFFAWKKVEWIARDFGAFHMIDSIYNK